MTLEQKLPDDRHESVQIGENHYSLEITEGESPAWEVRAFFSTHWPDSHKLPDINRSLKLGSLFILRDLKGDIVGLAQIMGRDLSFSLVDPDHRRRGIATFLSERRASYIEAHAEKHRSDTLDTKQNVLRIKAVTPEGLLLASSMREHLRKRCKIIIEKCTETSVEMRRLVEASFLYETESLASTRHRMAMGSSGNFTKAFTKYSRGLLRAIAADGDELPLENIMNNVGRYMLQAAFCADGKRWNLCRENIERALSIIDQNPDVYMGYQRDCLNDFLEFIQDKLLEE